MKKYVLVAVWLVVALAGAWVCWPSASATSVSKQRREVVFWHFWGGNDRAVVESIVDRFNASQDEHFVRAIAMPGNNLDMKLFMAVTGGDPPDVINQDDPIMADWASRGALLPLDEVANEEEVGALANWLVPAAARLGTYDGKLYALCNGLDIRALYYNKTILDAYGLQPPASIQELNGIAFKTTVIQPNGRVDRFGYLPDARRLWAWGVVFGGDFYNAGSQTASPTDQRIIDALDWMVSFRTQYGAGKISAFRQGDQSLPGKTFPLLAERYTVVMDGQWRVRDIAAAQQAQRNAGKEVTEYGVCPLPFPSGGRSHAGWVNGNFFLLPRNANNAEGAWEFMKFWSGFGGNEAEAAKTCVEGGWIPVSKQVSKQLKFQEFLNNEPLFAKFVELSEEPYQVPTPVVPGAAFFYRSINEAAANAMYVEGTGSPREVLQNAEALIQAQLERARMRGQQ